jgi:hypothetical protein
MTSAVIEANAAVQKMSLALLHDTWEPRAHCAPGVSAFIARDQRRSMNQWCAQAVWFNRARSQVYRPASTQWQHHPTARPCPWLVEHSLSRLFERAKVATPA